MSTTTYARGPVSLIADNHCGAGRETLTIAFKASPTADDIRRLNRELMDYGVEFAAALHDIILDSRGVGHAFSHGTGACIVHGRYGGCMDHLLMFGYADTGIRA